MKLFAILLIGLCCVCLCESNGKAHFDKLTKDKLKHWGNHCGADTSPEGICLATEWRKFASTIDSDKDGSVTAKDHIDMGDRFARGTTNETAKQDIRDWFLAIFPAVYDDGTGRTAVTITQVIEIYSQMGKENMVKIAGAVANFTFWATVPEGPGSFTLQNLKDFYTRWTGGTEAPWMDKVYKTLDTDGVKGVSLEEFRAGFVGYLINLACNSPFWGP